MNKSRLLQIFRSFTTKEIDAFSNFLAAKFYNDKNPAELARLFKLLKLYYPKLDHPNLKKEIAYHEVYGEIDWIPGKFEKLMSRFLKVTYQFINLYLINEHLSPMVSIGHFLQKRGLKPIFDREINKWQKELDKQPYLDSDILYEQFLLKELLVKEQAKIITSKIDLELPEMLESLDQYYILTKLKYACQLLAINLFILPVDIKNSLKSFEFLDHLINLPYLQIPIIQVYYQAYRMLNSEDNFRSENFDKFKNLLDEYDQQLSVTQQKSLHTLIRNYAILRYHAGEYEYLKRAFDIYIDHLEKGFLYYKGKILSQPLLNIVTFGLRLHEFDWVYDFILKHKNKIAGPEPTELIYDFNLSLYYFHTQNHEKALELLPDNFDDLYYKIGAKRLELIIYFETASQILDSKIDAFKIFIYRIPKSKITEKQKTANNNFIHLLKQIRHPKTEFNTSRIHKLKAKVIELNHIAEKEWLISQLDKAAEK